MVNEGVPRVVAFDASQGMTTNDAVVYVPTATESDCANVATYAADGHHGGMLGAGARVTVTLPEGHYAACVADGDAAAAAAAAAAARRRRLQSAGVGGFDVGDFVFRADLTIRSDPASAWYACVCPQTPPALPPSPPPPSPPPSPASPDPSPPPMPPPFPPPPEGVRMTEIEQAITEFNVTNYTTNYSVAAILTAQMPELHANISTMVANITTVDGTVVDLSALWDANFSISTTERRLELADTCIVTQVTKLHVRIVFNETVESTKVDEMMVNDWDSYITYRYILVPCAPPKYVTHEEVLPPPPSLAADGGPVPGDAQRHRDRVPRGRGAHGHIQPARQPRSRRARLPDHGAAGGAARVRVRAHALF